MRIVCNNRVSNKADRGGGEFPEKGRKGMASKLVEYIRTDRNGTYRKFSMVICAVTLARMAFSAHRRKKPSNGFNRTT